MRYIVVKLHVIARNVARAETVTVARAVVVVWSADKKSELDNLNAGVECLNAR